MKFKAFIAGHSAERAGVNAEGKPWQVRDITLCHPYKTTSGNINTETIITSCFLKLSDAKLEELEKGRIVLDCSVYFSTHEHDGRAFQDARLYEISVPILSEDSSLD